jgi:hypothetical protein
MWKREAPSRNKKTARESGGFEVEDGMEFEDFEFNDAEPRLDRSLDTDLDELDEGDGDTELMVLLSGMTGDYGDSGHD